ncbi:MAG: hypothetical protein A3F63_02280 [Pseudomonadales bacterium RIFCSPHIGHO2_12_FULL_40_16]|jgi:hypothetical protein|uniref:hypothetical protein n=1 Tax=Acinetobacter johnsonii TaxID=40214 RepID=UPI0008C092CB|nr:hypothetical protein [Acinetobacter johnsonii]MDH1706301.1 hypothetical protein [Acinetobacter johnsonii]OFW97151.1 MAG: hypothetical protein A2W44_15100 [Acinetobacter sp. RIFCSPHIGHO2_12_41_5]OHC24379.1 MAG: hypothetical protein A3F63_02280 [Pseudomonadales bacterium RIFCSPHIGHO2_12_FULL_40_16]UBQ36839.1 hypothetical protein LCH18_11605 [Acinetobacter johnsonii]
MYYSRLKLTVQAPLKLKDLTYKFVVINNNTKKRTQFEGRFDKQGLTGWTEIYNLNTSLIYEVYLRGEILQKISVKPYPDKKTHSVFTIKVTSEITKKVKENIKEIYLEDGVVGWYLVKQKETMLDWSKRIFKKTLIPSDWDVLRANNPHLKNIAAIKILIPGQVIVLCNTTTAKELNNYKSQAEKAELKLEKFLKDPKFDPLYFANSYDQLHEIKKNSDFVGLTNEPVQADFSDLFLQNMKSDPFIFASKESIDSAVNFNSTVNKEVANRYTVLLKKMDEAKQSKNPESFRRNFYLFERANAKEFEALKAASNKRFFSWNHGVNYKDNRDMIRRTVFVRAKNYSSIDDYIKNMDETSKVSKSLKWGGRLVFAWDIYGSVNSVAQVYEKGDSDGTRKEILKQTGKINGGLLGARIGGSIGTAIGGVVIGVVGGTVGLPVLAVVGVIAVGGTLIGGYVGGVTGQAVVEYGYERLK